MEMDGVDDVFKYNRFMPTDEEAVTYYLPRLIAGSALHGAEKLIHHVDFYSFEPRDLALVYAPAPQAVSTGDRFFFTTCKWKNGSRTKSARVAGAGTWTGNTTKNVYKKGAKVGEVKKLSFRKDDKCTGWVMEEYRWLAPEAAVDDGEMVLCKIHLSPTASAEARQESAAYFKRRQEAAAEPPVQEPDAVTVSVTASTHVQKRQAPAAAEDLSSSKKMRMAAAPVPALEEEYQDCPDWCAPAAAPVCSPAAGSPAAEAEEDTDRYSCSWEQIFGAQEEPAENNMEQFVPSSAEPVSGWESEALEEMQRLLADGEEERQAKEFVPSVAESVSDWEPEDLEEMQMLLADGEDDEQERQAKEAEEFMAGLEKWYNPAAVDPHTRSADGRRKQFFSSATVY